MLWNTGLWSEMDRLRQEMDGLVSNFGPAGGTATFPLVNVYEGKDDLVLTAEMPGLTRDQVNITYTDGSLTLSGKREPLDGIKNMSLIRVERTTGEFEKTIRLPVKVQPDKISATFRNGVLEITIPKAEEAKPKAIAIEVK